MRVWKLSREPRRVHIGQRDSSTFHQVHILTAPAFVAIVTVTTTSCVIGMECFG